MKPITAIYDGQSFRPAEPVDLPPNTKVQLTVSLLSPPKASRKSNDSSFLSFARTLNLEGPVNGSESIDDVLYNDVHGEDK